MMYGPKALKLHLSYGGFPTLQADLLNSQGSAWEIKALPFCLRWERSRFQDRSLKYFKISHLHKVDSIGACSKTPPHFCKKPAPQQTYAEL